MSHTERHIINFVKQEQKTVEYFGRLNNFATLLGTHLQ